MKIADILRTLAANLEHAEGGTPDPRLQNTAQLIDVEVANGPTDAEHDHPNGVTDSGNDREPENLFIPPLQQKQELLKKAVGVENIYDDGRPGEEGDANADAPTPEEEDVLEKIKRMAGVPVAAVQELSNDDVFND